MAFSTNKIDKTKNNLMCFLLFLFLYLKISNQITYFEKEKINIKKL